MNLINKTKNNTTYGEGKKKERIQGQENPARKT
jgi:hypothetical protein